MSGAAQSYKAYIRKYLPRFETRSTKIIRLVADQDQKFFNIFQINDFYLGKASPKYATEVIHALRQAEGHLTFSVKRAQIREVVYRQS